MGPLSKAFIKIKSSKQLGIDLLNEVSSSTCDKEKVRYLIKAGADVETKTEDGYTPLAWAAQNGFADIIEVLAKAGANPNVRYNHDTRIPLIHAAQEGKSAVVEKLLAVGADLDCRGGIDQSTALIESVTGRLGSVLVPMTPEKEKIAACLIKAGAKLDLQDDEGMTALTTAIYWGNEKIARRLMEAGAKLNLQGKKGNTALIFAIDENLAPLVHDIITAGADLNMQNVHGNTALICAAAKGQNDIVRDLIAAGALASIRNNLGMTALDVARKEGHAAIIAVLEPLTDKPPTTAASPNLGRPAQSLRL